MLKIKDFTVGSTVETTLLLKEATILNTRAGKPYLNAQLTDGSDTVKSVDWDWGNKAKPTNGIVVDVTAEVTEYMGSKQLKLKSMQLSDQGVELFAPSGDINVNEYVLKAKALYDGIVNDQARELVTQMFRDNAQAWRTIPAAKGMHHAYVAGMLKHSVDVATKAKAIAEVTPCCNIDLVVAGALLHDFGKLWTYYLNGALIEMTDMGQMVEHIMLGAMKLDKYRTQENSDVLDLILHIVSSHHGELEYGSPTTPRFLEAVIVNYADGIDAKTEMVLDANKKAGVDAKFTDKIWTMGNRPFFTQFYIESVME